MPSSFIWDAYRMQGVGSLPWESLDEKQHTCNKEQKGNQTLPGQPALGYNRDRRGERGKEHAVVSSLSAWRDSSAEERPWQEREKERRPL